jgi:PKD repeat protein
VDGTLQEVPQLAIPAGPYTPGQSYFGRNGYIEYVAGNAPVIYSAAHGGSLTPSEIPDRTAGTCGGAATTTTDLNTQELVRTMQARHFARFGNYPHIVINRLHRRKLDANRDILEGACADAEAQIAWNEFQDFIDVAKTAVLSATGRGWYMDMHGHGHEIQRLELGYLISGVALRRTDGTLDGTVVYEDSTSIKTISEASPLTFSALLRGASSLGTLYANNNFPSVPASNDPYPESGESYFSGGYNTARHGCGIEASGLGGVSGGNICGVQIEANLTGVRDSNTNRTRFADVTASVLDTFLSTHWGLDIGAGGPPNSAPVASFTYGCSGLGCSFVDTSADGDGTIVSRNWTFGDGGTSTAQNPTHSYAVAGTYTVTLSVTDDDGASNGRSEAVSVSSPSGITLTLATRKVRGNRFVDLTWSGAAGTTVDVYRNNSLIVNTANDGAHTDALGKASGTFTYRVCNAGTGVCSNQATASS